MSQPVITNFFDVGEYRVKVCVTSDVKITCLNTITNKLYYKCYDSAMTFTYLQNFTNFYTIMKSPNLTIGITVVNNEVKCHIKYDQHDFLFDFSLTNMPLATDSFFSTCCNNINDFINANKPKLDSLTQIINNETDDSTKTMIFNDKLPTILQELTEFIENETCVKYADLIHHPQFKHFHTTIEIIKKTYDAHVAKTNSIIQAMSEKFRTDFTDRIIDYIKCDFADDLRTKPLEHVRSLVRVEILDDDLFNTNELVEMCGGSSHYANTTFIITNGTISHVETTVCKIDVIALIDDFATRIFDEFFDSDGFTKLYEQFKPKYNFGKFNKLFGGKEGKILVDCPKATFLIYSFDFTFENVMELFPDELGGGIDFTLVNYDNMTAPQKHVYDSMSEV